MAFVQTKRVKYSANERLDLNDKLAEDTLAAAEMGEFLKNIVRDDPDGRVFTGFRTTTTTGPNGGFALAAEKSFAYTRDGVVLILDGSISLTQSLTTNAINYVHAFYDENDTDNDSRRFYITGSEVNEVNQSTDTRTQRTVDLYVKTATYGTPTLAGFDTIHPVNSRQLIPLYAVPVDSGDTITSVVDFRPLFAFVKLATGGNQYEAAVPDSHNFSPTDAATIGIDSIRKGFVALADRLKQTKGTTNWWDDDFGSITLTGHITKKGASDNSYLTVCGSHLTSGYGRIDLYGSAHATRPGYVDTTGTYFRWLTTGAVQAAQFDTTNGRFIIGSSTTGRAKLTIYGDYSGRGIALPNNVYVSARNAANSADIDILKVDTSDRTLIQSYTNSDIRLVPGGTGDISLETGDDLEIVVPTTGTFRIRNVAADALIFARSIDNSYMEIFPFAANADSIINFGNFAKTRSWSWRNDGYLDATASDVMTLYYNGTTASDVMKLYNNDMATAAYRLVWQMAAKVQICDPSYLNTTVLAEMSGVQRLLVTSNIDSTTPLARFRRGTGSGQGTLDIIVTSGSAMVQASDKPLYLSTGMASEIVFSINGTIRSLFDTSGNFRPYATKTYDLGSASYFWGETYVNTIFIANTSTGISATSTTATFTVGSTTGTFYVTFAGSGDYATFVRKNVQASNPAVCLHLDVVNCGVSAPDNAYGSDGDIIVASNSSPYTYEGVWARYRGTWHKLG